MNIDMTRDYDALLAEAQKHWHAADVVQHHNFFVRERHIKNGGKYGDDVCKTLLESDTSAFKKWSTWKKANFGKALNLVYDDLTGAPIGIVACIAGKRKD